MSHKWFSHNVDVCTRKSWQQKKILILTLSYTRHKSDLKNNIVHHKYDLVQRETDLLLYTIIHDCPQWAMPQNLAVSDLASDYTISMVKVEHVTFKEGTLAIW